MSSEDPEVGLEELDGEDVVELTDDEGNSVAFAILLVVELDGVEYAALTPVDQLEDEESEDDQDIYLFVYEEHEEEDGILQSFSPIDDEATFEMVREFCSNQLELLSGA